MALFCETYCFAFQNLLFQDAKVIVLACETYCFANQNNRFRNALITTLLQDGVFIAEDLRQYGCLMLLFSDQKRQQ